MYVEKVYPGIIVAGIDVGGKTQDQVKTLFWEKNNRIAQTLFTFKNGTDVATISASDLGVGFDAKLLATQAYSIGRSPDLSVNLSTILQAYINTLYLPPAYTYNDQILTKLLTPLAKRAYIAPVDALFRFESGKVVAFQPSASGSELDVQTVKTTLETQIPTLLIQGGSAHVIISIPVKALEPTVTTDKANSFGIKELLGSGTSLFNHSIPGRIYNISLAASRVNGILVGPGEEFSFDKVLGDVSSFNGYKQAYVIQNGKTVLGDGGGVCQVSTTLFRAILNAGLPITERNAHAYRVGYYEEDSPPGLDATIYVPTVDLKFKNDTGAYILIQNTVDLNENRITYFLYGQNDQRQVVLTQPIIKNETPAPDPLYQDDPTLPKGEIKQVDYAANGATVSFSRTVTKNGNVLISETFVSNYRPWQAVYLRGTQEL